MLAKLNNYIKNCLLKICYYLVKKDSINTY